MEQDNLLTTKEVADILEVTTATVLKYAKEGRLAPYTEDPFQIDSSKLFKEVDVLQLQKENHKPGLTTGEAAEKLGVTPQTVKNFIKSGELTAAKHPYRGREIYFISKEDFEKFDDSYTTGKKRGMKEFFLKDGKRTKGLFQLYRNRHTYEYGRIMDLGKGEKGYLKTEKGREIQLDEKEFDEFLPINKIEEKPYILKKGYAVFEFALSENVMSHTYKIIDLFYTHAGPKNMKLVVLGGKIHVEVKPITIRIETQYHQEDIKLLTNVLVEGKVKYGPAAIVIESDLMPVTVNLPLSLKEKVKEDAKKAGMSMDEYVLSIIKEKYE